MKYKHDAGGVLSQNQCKSDIGHVGHDSNYMIKLQSWQQMCLQSLFMHNVMYVIMRIFITRLIHQL